MLLRILVALAGLAAFVPMTQGAEPAPSPAFVAADRAAIESVIHRYFDAFTRKDYGSFGDYYQAPFLAFGRDAVVVPTLEEVVQRYRGIRDPLDQADYSASKAVEIRITPVTVMRALANLRWQRLRKDGSVLDEGSEFMIMSKTTGTWKIAGVMGQQLALFGN